MVIAPGRDGITAVVIIGDGEKLPMKWNTEKVLVFRQGDSTNRELMLLKPLGEVLLPEAVKKALTSLEDSDKVEE